MPESSGFIVGSALLSYLLIVGTLTSAVLLIVLAGSVASYGSTGPLVVGATLKLAVVDWLGTSFRRVLAIAILTAKESIRKKTLLGLAVFAVLMLFAGWFLGGTGVNPEEQVRVYVSFVVTAISWLVLLMLLVISTMGIPDDIRIRSIHTVVTKPVRRQEIVLGRILGYSAVALSVIAVLGGVAYIWLNRALPERARELMVARVPVYGDLQFLDREGRDSEAGVNTGDEWMFRSYVEGNTKARAIWTFTGLDPAVLKSRDELRLESTFQVFRTHKGNMDRGISCQMIAVNPKTGARATLRRIVARDDEGRPTETEAAFEVREFRQNVHDIPRTLSTPEGRPVDLFDDLIDNGTLRVEVLCLNTQQFMGAAKPDLFVRLPDRSFFVSYAKGMLGIALMTEMVVVMGVMASTFAKWPVAMLLTLFTMGIGNTDARPFLDSIVTRQLKGGGVLESVYRIATHQNPYTDLEVTVPVRVMKAFDWVGVQFLTAVRYFFPDLRYFNLSPYVASGFDVPWGSATPPYHGALLPALLTTAAYVVPWIVVAYFSLRLRELEAK